MYKIIVPKENVNDEEVTIVKVISKDKSMVKKGDSIFEIETTKVNIDIEAPIDGVINHSLSEGDILKIGDTLAIIDDGSNKEIDDNKSEEKELSTINPNIQISKAALKRAEELNVDLSKIKGGMVTISDIENMSKIKSKKIKEGSVVIIGAGGHAKTCIDILLHNKQYEIIGILDPNFKVGDMISNIKVIGDNSSLDELVSNGLKNAINGIGSVHNPGQRKKVFDLLKSYKLNVLNVIHPSAVIEPSVEMGEGNQIMMGSMIGSNTIIKDNCLINSGSIVSHDCILKDHCHIAPGAVLAGSVQIGESSLVGMNSTVYINCKIGKNSVIYNGINVFSDIEENSIIEK